MMKLLDLYCGAGGAGMGYHRAGFEVVGVDINPQPNYPFEFIQMDALDAIGKYGSDFDVVHASPPCQKYSRATAPARSKGKVYVDLLGATRIRLDELGKPYIIENVPSSPMRVDIRLRGDMFGLKVLRERWFELGGGLFLLAPCKPTKIGSVKAGDYCSVFGKGAYRKSKGDAFPKFKKESVLETWKYAMGIDWMKRDRELAESIPPAYTEYLGNAIKEQIQTKISCNT